MERQTEARCWPIWGHVIELGFYSNVSEKLEKDFFSRRSAWLGLLSAMLAFLKSKFSTIERPPLNIPLDQSPVWGGDPADVVADAMRRDAAWDQPPPLLEVASRWSGDWTWCWDQFQTRYFWDVCKMFKWIYQIGLLKVDKTGMSCK